MKCLLLIAVLVGGLKSCPDRWALEKVDVWTHRLINQNGEHRKSISINDLYGNEMIELTKANVSVLCEGMIKNFNRLKYLTLVDANISKIESGALQNLPVLTHLSLAVNHLVTIERSQFQKLTSLRVLYLSKNAIEDIEEDAFVDVPNLRKIYLDRNKIHEIDSKWFLSNNQISLIDLSFNKISKIQDGAFSLPENGKIEIRLQNNEVEEIEPNALTTNAIDNKLPYLTLRLQHNKFSTISQDLLKKIDKFHSKLSFDSNLIQCFTKETLQVLKEVTVELQANDNPISCDCLEAATNFVKDHELKATFYYSSSNDCQLPGLRVDSWNHQNSANTYFSS